MVIAALFPGFVLAGLLKPQTVSFVQPRRSRKPTQMKRILLTTVCAPFGVNREDCTEHIMPELFHAQVTRAQGVFSPRVTYISYGLEYIAENLQAPVTVLQYPTMRQFRRELRKGYDYVGINFVIATFEKMRAMCSAVRELSPESEIVLGGYGTMLPECEPYGDHICREEGVAFFRRLLGEPPDGELRHVVYPTRGTIAGVPAMKGAVVMAGLGCPHGCEFCATSHFHKQRHIPLLKTGSDLYREIRRVHTSLGNPRLPIGIIEEDFLIHRDRAREYLDCVKQDRRDPIKISCFASARAISMWDPDDLVRMGVEAIWIGVESRRADYSKLKGLDITKIMHSLHERGINTLASLIIGHDFHTLDMIRDDLEYLISLRPSLSQFLIMTPACSTPFFERLRDQGRLIADVPHREWDGFHLTFTHPNISKPDMEQALLDMYDEEYRRLGPSVLRYVERQLDGYLRYRNSDDELLRIRAEQYRSECVAALPLFPTAIRNASSPPVADWLLGLQQRIRARAGSGGLKNALLSAVVPLFARVQQFRLDHCSYPQAKLLRTEYRGGARPGVQQAEAGFSIISRPQPLGDHTLVIDLSGTFGAVSVAAARAKIEAFLAGHRGSLALSFSGLTFHEPVALVTLLEKLRQYRERIQLIGIDTLHEDVAAYARDCFEVFADLRGLQEAMPADG